MCTVHFRFYIMLYRTIWSLFYFKCNTYSSHCRTANLAFVLQLFLHFLLKNVPLILPINSLTQIKFFMCWPCFRCDTLSLVIYKCTHCQEVIRGVYCIDKVKSLNPYQTLVLQTRQNSLISERKVIHTQHNRCNILFTGYAKYTQRLCNIAGGTCGMPHSIRLTSLFHSISH